MSFIRAKQIKLANKGDLLLAGDNGAGTVLSKGNNGMYLLSGTETLSYSYVNQLRHTEGTSTLLVDRDAGANAGEKLTIKSYNGETHIVASNTAGTGNVNIILKPQGNGQVIIDSVGNSTIQAGNNETLYLKSGDATTINANGFNLVLAGGLGNGTGRTGLVVGESGYALPVDAPAEAFTTKGYVSDQISNVSRTEYRDQITVSTPTENYQITLTHTPLGSIDVLYNGIALDTNHFTLSGTTVTLNDSTIGYSVEIDDVLQVRYEYNA